MKSPKVPEIRNPNPPQAPTQVGSQNMSAMYTSPMRAMFAPLSAGLMQKRAGRRSLLGS